MQRHIAASGWDWNSLPYSPDRGEYDSLDESFFTARIDEVDSMFFLVGFPKAATTTIASILYHHPKIRLPVDKEPKFFSTDEYDHGTGFYWEKYFQDAYDGEPVLGDAATSNSYIPFVPRRIAEAVPDAKIIFSLRNPVDRAFSNWWMYYRSGLENLTFADAVEWELTEQEHGLLSFGEGAEDDEYWHWYRRRQVTNDRFIRRRTIRTYLLRGYYADHIQRFRRYFDDDQILYLFQDRLFEDRVKEINRILSFLDLTEVESISVPDGHTAPKHPLHGWITNHVLSYQDVVPDPVWSFGGDVLNAVTGRLPGSVEMDAGIREKLLDHYREYNAELESIVNRDLSDWNRSARY